MTGVGESRTWFEMFCRLGCARSFRRVWANQGVEQCEVRWRVYVLKRKMDLMCAKADIELQVGATRLRKFSRYGARFAVHMKSHHTEHQTAGWSTASIIFWMLYGVTVTNCSLTRYQRQVLQPDSIKVWLRIFSPKKSAVTRSSISTRVMFQLLSSPFVTSVLKV